LLYVLQRTECIGLPGYCLCDDSINERKTIMMYGFGRLFGWAGGGAWIWMVIGVLVVTFLIVAIVRVARR